MTKFRWKSLNKTWDYNMWQTPGKMTTDKHMEISIKGRAQKEYNFNPKLTI
jgi:hypothetical protein